MDMEYKHIIDLIIQEIDYKLAEPIDSVMDQHSYRDLRHEIRKILESFEEEVLEENRSPEPDEPMRNEGYD